MFRTPPAFLAIITYFVSSCAFFGLPEITPVAGSSSKPSGIFGSDVNVMSLPTTVGVIVTSVRVSHVYSLSG